MAARRLWNEENVVSALRIFEERFGRKPAFDECRAPRELGLPSCTAVVRVFGSWSNAMIVAFGESWPQGGVNQAKDEDTELVLAALKEGRSLTDLGRERGITGQALGRRVRRSEERRVG